LVNTCRSANPRRRVRRRGRPPGQLADILCRRIAPHLRARQRGHYGL
jgi:hypothetical protein